jgi:penicillin-binding protein 1B
VATQRRPEIRGRSRSLPGRSRELFSRLKRYQKGLILAALLLAIVGAGVFVYAYVKFSREIDARLGGTIFDNTSTVFASPTPIREGDPVSAADVAAHLRKALYSEGEPADKGSSTYGTYRLRGNRLEIRPGPDSYFHGGPVEQGPVAIEFSGKRVASIAALDNPATTPDRILLEPEAITTLFDQSRTKRRLVQYGDLPPDLINAILAAEDHRFFSHHGVSLWRMLGAAVADIRADDRAQGGSTLTMQLARNFFLTRRRTFRRKAEEVFLALLLEQRLSKQEIFELYANQVYLGQRGSFSINGLGEAADVYFGKDVKSLTLPEDALLAGIIRGPNLYSPYRASERATERRDYVLHRMEEDGFITPAQATAATQTPLHVVARNLEGSQAPYFVDMLKDQLLAQFSEHDLVSQRYRIYTTLDLDAQRAASEGVRDGMAEVDRLVHARKRRKDAPPEDPDQPQVALLALDPQTGEVRAMVGGRNYADSQLNHVLARRQPGSSFKPFVYAAALSTAVNGGQPVITPATILQDEPTTFEYEEKTYEPRNYREEYHGAVTMREALMLSLNSATVSLGQMVGYDKVRDLAVAAGINRELLATPALALGAYVATPLEIAGAYTIFANDGQYVAPRLILEVRDTSGRVLLRTPEERHQVLDPRVSYLMVNLMESVINNGTAYGVRSRGFSLPAAGKTGSSHDAWFAGFTSNLLAVVWVGYDDDRNVRLTGAQLALPVWTDFMKAAAGEPQYRDAQDFAMPPGIVTATVDLHTNPGATGDSVVTRTEYFIEGTEPQPASGGVAGVLSKIFHLGKSQDPPAAVAPPAAAPRGLGPTALTRNAKPAAQTEVAGGDTSATAADSGTDPKPRAKKGVFRKFLSIFKGGDRKKQAAESSQQ